MKKSDVLMTLAFIIQDNEEFPDIAASKALVYLEGIGMLPPICTVTVKDGKHTPTERCWDEESQ